MYLTQAMQKPIHKIILNDVALSAFQGDVCLIYGSESKICTKRRVNEALEFSPHLKAYCVEGAGHPVPYGLTICELIQDELEVTG